MKKFILLLPLFLLLQSCESNEPKDILKGKTYHYYNGYTGKYRIFDTFEFKKSGNVFHESVIGDHSYDTKGCSLYYRLNGNTITIYHGVIGWEKSVRHTVYRTGTYHGSYIIIDGLQYDLLDY